MSEKKSVNQKREVPWWQRNAMMEGIKRLFGEAKSCKNENRILQIKKTLVEYGEFLGIEIDLEKWEVIEDRPLKKEVQKP